MLKWLLGLSTLLACVSLALGQTTTGTWELYPPQSKVYEASVQQPINPDGTSTWPANKGVVPVQFKLSQGYGPVVFESIQSSGSYSSLTFSPSNSIDFSQITNLTAEYAFTTGNCHGGSLRWTVHLDTGKQFDIYYGDLPNYTECISGTNNCSGLNILNQTGSRYDLRQLGGAYYDTHQNAVDLAGTAAVQWIALILDSGWGGDQAVTLGHVTVNDNTFQPLTGSTPTCDLPAANIQVSRTSGTPGGVIDEITSIQPNDTGTSFRIVDCKYMYNLAAKSLGVGVYKVEVLINNQPAAGFGKFDLR